jgi:hypothetical protein
MRRYHIDAVIRERSEGPKGESDGKSEGDGQSKKNRSPLLRT